ncbi:trypsin-like peptidase domain-containing protein [Candidatus Poribacteria bacterium]|nr:trypsin-like peptidase domain-containing protein [Candidatus Poribacteria bacterium]
MGEAQSKSERQADVSISRRNAIVNAVEYASPAVVNISTTRTTTVNVSPFFDDFWAPFFDFPFQVPQRRTLHGLGSGVIFDQKGYVITNQHVIERADSITVLLSDGREASAEVAGEDFLTDLAVLKIDMPELKAIELGNAEDLLIGEWAIAIGHPFATMVEDASPTVTVGVVSATGRSLKTEDRLYRNLIQTDASINPGNSGGGLVNLYGQLIGINTAIYSTSGGSQGVGFAIPVNVVQKVVDQLVTYGAVIPPEIGIEPQDLTQRLVEALDLEEGIGVLVAGVKRGSPAEAAGFRRRDVIEAIDQKPISNSETFWAITRLLREDQVKTFRVLRDGKRKDLRLRIRELQWSYAVPGWGITIEQLNQQQTEKYTQRGVLVTKIQPRGTLAERGLKRGDLIYRINSLKVNSLEDFKRIINQLQRPQQISLYFQRDSKRWELSDLIIR